jgi:hypothetical protein
MHEETAVTDRSLCDADDVAERSDYHAPDGRAQIRWQRVPMVAEGEGQPQAVDGKSWEKPYVWS